MKTSIICMILVIIEMMKDIHTHNNAQWTNIMLDPDALDDSNNDWMNNPREYIYTGKRSKDLEQVNKIHLTPKDIFSSNSPWQWFCPCETQYEIVDLGQENYPRYFATAHCTAKPCHGKFNPCKLIYYKVHFLSQRELGSGSDTTDEQSEYIEQSILPESLRVKWQLKPLKVAVACVSATEGQNKWSNTK